MTHLRWSKWIKLENMSADLRSHFKGWMESSVGDMNGGTLCRFIIAGVSDSSALVAYEELGFVPSTHATLYVHTMDGWVAARKWDNVGYPKSLVELLASVEQFAVPVSGH